MDAILRDELEDARKAGCVFYSMPWELDPNIDPLIRPAVERINKSIWLWTAESCQGHPDAAAQGAWASNTDPMIRLVTRAEHAGAMMAGLLRAYQGAADRELRDCRVFECGGLRVFPTVRGEWAEVLVYVGARNVFQRGQAILVWDLFAEEVARR